LVLEQILGTRTLRKCQVLPATRDRRLQTLGSSKLWPPRPWKQSD
jgi:hypothetical protein